MFLWHSVLFKHCWSCGAKFNSVHLHSYCSVHHWPPQQGWTTSPIRAEAADGVICLSFVVLHRGYMQRWGWVTHLVFRCDYVMTTQVLMQGWSHKEQMVRCRRSRQVRSVCQGKHRLCDAAALLQPQSPVTLIYTTALWDTGDDRTNIDCDFPSLTCCALSVRKLVIHWQTAEQLMFMLQNRIKSKTGKRKKEKGMWRNGYLVLVLSFD